jgi:peroxiredoxin (alkyl hydroperoxide reductase subunit C)
MKKFIPIVVLILINNSLLCAKDASHKISVNKVLIGQAAPEFTAQAVVGGVIKPISLQDFEGKYKLLFFYPADFSYVCPTELFALQDNLKEFEKRHVAVLGVSVDSVHTHSAWLSRPKSDGGIEGITYPIIADITKEISRQYQVLDEQNGIALRGVVLLDRDNRVQALQLYNTDIGRSISEILRIIDALQFTEENGQVCPANWQPGDHGIDATPQGIKDFWKK